MPRPGSRVLVKRFHGQEIAAKQARLDSTERKTVDDVKEAAYTILDEKATSEQLRELEEKLTKQSIELHEKLSSLDAKLTKKIDEQINSNYGLLDLKTELRNEFFFALKRDMWRGFSAEGAQHQMKQHIRSHKEPAPRSGV